MPSRDTNAFSSFFKTIFQVDGSLPTSAPGKASESLIGQLSDIIRCALKAWGPPTTIQSRSKRVLSGEIPRLSPDETHNRYALQEELLHLLEPLYGLAPNRFLHAILLNWPHFCFACEDEMLVQKMVVIEVLNGMGNVHTEGLLKSCFELMKTGHISDQLLLKAMAKKKLPPM